MPTPPSDMSGFLSGQDIIFTREPLRSHSNLCSPFLCASICGHAIEIEGCFELENRNIAARKHTGIPGITSNSLANLGQTHDVLWTNGSTVSSDSRHRRWAH